MMSRLWGKQHIVYLFQSKRLLKSNKLKEAIQKHHEHKRDEVNKYFNDVVKPEIEFIHRTIVERSNIEFNKLNEHLHTYQKDANAKRLEAESKLNDMKRKKQSMANEETIINEQMDLDYVDTLMINEENDIDVDENNNELNELNEGNQAIDTLVNTVEKYINKKLVKCKPVLSEFCFLHDESNETFDHNSFEFDTNQYESPVYSIDKECSIKISCPTYGRNIEELLPSLTITILDSKKNNVKSSLVHRVTEDAREFKLKILFKPELAGMHKLQMKFDGYLTKDCPFYFPVYKDMPRAMNKSNLSSSNDHVNVQMPLSVRTMSKQPTSMGRGRIIRNLRNNFNVRHHSQPEALVDSLIVNEPSNENVPMVDLAIAIVGQKRKSPTYLEQDTLEQVSNKRVVVNKQQNQTHTYHGSSTSSINVVEQPQVPLHSRLSHPSNHQFSNINLSGILDTHLNKYSKDTLGQMPSLKATFVAHYEAKLNFPIGICVSSVRNWLVIADTGNHVVKIIDRTSGTLLHSLSMSSDGKELFRRPSALLISEKDAELFVKDDKEIFAFDLNTLTLKRQFGFKILRKPYGMTFDHEENIVLVDANLRDPRIVKFSKDGRLLSSNRFQPMDQQVASDLSMFANLKQPAIHFDKTKIRFMCFAHNCLYVSDLGRSIVYKCSLDGQILLAFGHNGRTKGEINEPSGILVDIGGSILVGDSKNDRLQIYDQDGKYKCQIEFQEARIKRPSDIYVDGDGFLYVTCFLEHCVKKFKFDF